MLSVSVEREYLTPRLVANLIGVQPETVLLWIDRGEMKASDLSEPGSPPRYYVHRSDVEAFMARRADRKGVAGAE